MNNFDANPLQCANWKCEKKIHYAGVFERVFMVLKPPVILESDATRRSGGMKTREVALVFGTEEGNGQFLGRAYYTDNTIGKKLYCRECEPMQTREELEWRSTCMHSIYRLIKSEHDQTGTLFDRSLELQRKTLAIGGYLEALWMIYKTTWSEYETTAFRKSHCPTTAECILGHNPAWLFAYAERYRSLIENGAFAIDEQDWLRAIDRISPR